MKFLMIAMISVGVALAGCGKHDHSKHEHGTTGESHADKVKDPVCLMEIDKAGARTETHDNQTYQFCSQECQTKFKADPVKYVK